MWVIRLKILISIFIAFLISAFVAKYSQTPGSPNINTNKIVTDAKNITISFADKINPAKLISIISFPVFVAPTNTLVPSKYPTQKPISTPIIHQPSVTDPTSTPYPSFPTSKPTSRPNQTTSPTTKPSPTTIPPTPKPLPTVVSEIFPVDQALKRPGASVDEVFKIGADKTCVPKEVIRTIASIESGGFFNTVSTRYFFFYNSYNWWNSEFLTEQKRTCSGYDYDSNTGLVPSDSKFAGTRCRNGSNSGLTTMGPMQVSTYEQSQYGKDAARKLGVSAADRRVILDAIIIAGLIIQDNVKAGCGTWSGKDVIKAACAYYGSCGIRDGTYYCATFCRNYKSFGGKADCEGALNSMGDNCWQ